MTAGFQKHSATSRAAAEECTTINTMEGQILDRLGWSITGWTADELHQHIISLWPDVQAGTIAARLRGLQIKGLIVKGAGERRTRSGRMANEWWLTETAKLMNVDLAAAAPDNKDELIQAVIDAGDEWAISRMTGNPELENEKGTALCKAISALKKRENNGRF